MSLPAPPHSHNSLHFSSRWASSNGFATALRSRSDDSTAASTISHPFTFSAPLQELTSYPRTVCPVCKKSRRGWCPSCYRCFIPESSKPRTLDLPIPIDVLQHRGEKAAASSTVHLKLMAPSSVNVYSIPTIPDYATENTAVLLPGDGAVPITELSPQELSTLTKLIVLDCSWTQAAPMIRANPVVAGMRRIALSQPSDDVDDPANTSLRDGMFWRHKKKSRKSSETLGDEEMWLSTAEAVYVAVSQLEQARAKVKGKPYKKDAWDDLLWTYTVQHQEAVGQMLRRYDMREQVGESHRQGRRKRRRRGEAGDLQENEDNCGDDENKGREEQ